MLQILLQRRLQRNMDKLKNQDEAHASVEVLAQRIKKGDETALEEVTRKFTPLVSTIISNIAGGCFGTEDLEEVTADTFITLWYNRKRIQTDKLKGFICCIAKNKAKNKIRSNLRHQKVVSIDEMDFESDLDVPQKIDDRSLSEALIKALDEIGEPDKEIIIRHYYYYQSSTIISEKMQMNADTVKSRIRRAREKLKKLLTERGYKK